MAVGGGLALALALTGCRDDPPPDATDSTGTSTGGTADGTATTTAVADTGTSTGVGSGGSTTVIEPTTTDDPTTTGDPTTGGVACGDGVPAAGELCFLPSETIADVPTGVLVLGDLDDDGAPDIIAGHEDSFSVLMNQGDGTFSAPDVVPIVTPTPSGTLGLVVGYFDGDANLDLAVANTGDDSVGIHLGNGDGTFAPVSLEGAGNAPAGLAVGDFDGDGNLDLAVANSFGDTVTVLLGQGDGNFLNDGALMVGTNPLGVAALDLDAPNDDDLAVVNFGSGSISVFLSDPGGFSPEASFVTGIGPRNLAIGDFDDDGALDVATPNQAGDNLAVLTGTGTGVLDPAVFFSVGDGPRWAAVGDFDGDALPDIAVALEPANAVAVLRDDRSGALSFEPAVPLPTLDRPVVLGIGDLDGDGVDDIVAGSIEAGGGIAVILADP